MEQFAGCLALEAAAALVIEFMGGGFNGRSQRRCFFTGFHSFCEAAFEVADRFFHRAVVGRIVRWAVEREHFVLGENDVHLLAVEG